MSLGQLVHGQTTAVVGWTPPTDGLTIGFYVYYGNASGQYTTKVDVGSAVSFSLPINGPGTNYFFAVSSYDASGSESELSPEVAFKVPKSLFFLGQADLSKGFEYLQLPDGNPFGYYTLTSYPWMYHLDLGWEYCMDANDGQNGLYLYDLASKTFWYTTPQTFPYIFDFSLGSWIYYYPSSTAGRYSSNPRTFFDFATSKVVTK